MDDSFGKLLISRYAGRASVPVHCNSPDHSRVAVIVETRRSFWLPIVIRNAIDKLGNGWNLHAIVPRHLNGWLAEELPDWQYAITELQNPQVNVDGYSQLLLMPALWERFREDWLLVFQTDCAFARAVPEWAFEFDYIGPLCGVLNESEFIINGGLSLRRRPAFTRASHEIALRRANDPTAYGGSSIEDIVFTRHMRQHCDGDQGYRLPSMQQCNDFAGESFIAPTAIGVHGTDKGYAKRDEIEAFVRRASASHQTSA